MVVFAHAFAAFWLLKTWCAAAAARRPARPLCLPTRSPPWADARACPAAAARPPRTRTITPPLQDAQPPVLAPQGAPVRVVQGGGGQVGGLAEPRAHHQRQGRGEGRGRRRRRRRRRRARGRRRGGARRERPGRHGGAAPRRAERRLLARPSFPRARGGARPRAGAGAPPLHAAARAPDPPPRPRAQFASAFATAPVGGGLESDSEAGADTPRTGSQGRASHHELFEALTKVRRRGARAGRLRAPRPRRRRQLGDGLRVRGGRNRAALPRSPLGRDDAPHRPLAVAGGQPHRARVARAWLQLPHGHRRQGGASAHTRARAHTHAHARFRAQARPPADVRARAPVAGC